ncbi:hypothetical protein SD961_08975 [Erwinia sp. MMLR14_017]|nr:hypothetical protein [Erwinia sp. MMLR14_017]MDW8846025.1 hypothetical protein [Erwinia sp. MMLR14_017]
MSNEEKKPQPGEQDHPAKDAPDQHGEIPRTRDDSDDDKHDPFQDK